MPDNHIEIINPVLKRMADYLRFKGIAPTRADKLMESGNGRFGKMLTNNTEPKPPFIENFLRTFPEVNRNWLEKNDGEMVNPLFKKQESQQNLNKSDHNEPNQETMTEMQKKIYEDFIQNLQDQLAELKRENAELKGVKAKSHAS